MKQFLWLSYDFGVGGDYEGLFAFLDDHSAEECGSNTAAFWFSYQSDLFAELADALKSRVTLGGRSRIYVITSDEKRKVVGKFLVGKRKAAQWRGFGSLQQQAEDFGG